MKPPSRRYWPTTSSSPVPWRSRPIEAKPSPRRYSARCLRVFEDFEYRREIVSADGTDAALVFEAKVKGKTISGCDFLHLDEQGKIDEFTVMVRPLSAATALAEAMGAQFEQIVAESTA